MEDAIHEKQYRAYITDTLMTLTNNVAHGLGGGAIKLRWMDLYKEPDTRTADEVALDVVKNAGLKIGGEDADGPILTRSQAYIR